MAVGRTKNFREKAMELVDRALPDLSDVNKARTQVGLDALATAGHGIAMASKATATWMIGALGVTAPFTASSFGGTAVGVIAAPPMIGAAYKLGTSTMNSWNEMILAGKTTAASFREMMDLTRAADAVPATPPGGETVVTPPEGAEVVTPPSGDETA
ncbi:MAG: hypothetical protein ABH834_02130 [Candidatus Altiarchaeota archaeon]